MNIEAQSLISEITVNYKYTEIEHKNKRLQNIGEEMTHRESIAYNELLRAYRNNLRWLGLSDSARNVLAFLLTEKQWTDQPQSPEDICNATGLARSSISAIMSQLTSLGFVESEIDTSEEVVGRRKTLHRVGKGLTGLILFGLRRLNVELQALVNDLSATISTTETKNHVAQNVLRISLEEAERNLQIISSCSEQVLEESRALSKEKSVKR
ncbi:MAG: helix-turn-helix domain-containing protein [Candidatus Thorarchaeota archaeon]|jgi:DNA-binding transcriptional regulator GbsR (MarR family)